MVLATDNYYKIIISRAGEIFVVSNGSLIEVPTIDEAYEYIDDMVASS